MDDINQRVERLEMLLVSQRVAFVCLASQIERNQNNAEVVSGACDIVERVSQKFVGVEAGEAVLNQTKIHALTLLQVALSLGEGEPQEGNNSPP